MSPRHFANTHKYVLPKDVARKDLGPNLWFAFTRVTGIADLFVFTPKELSNKIDKDYAKGIKK